MNLLTVLDWTARLGHVLRRQPAEGVSTRERIVLESNERHENLVGRFDVSDRVRCRVLDVPASDYDLATDQGLVFNDNEGVFEVPDHLNVDDFKVWWPRVAEDLRDSQARLMITKEGRRVEGFVQGDDLGQGSDSTATPLMYVAFPVIGALTYLLASWMGGTGYLALLLTIPYFVALKQGEGMKEAFKAWGLFQFIPLAIASGATGLLPGVGSFGQTTLLSVGMMLGFATSLVVLLLFVAFLSAASHPHRGAMGGTAERFIHMMKWLGVVVVVAVASPLLPFGIGAAMPFVLACAYCMQYTEGNFVQTGGRLYLQNESNNLATQGALVQSHVKAREQQAEAAHKDTTPLIAIARATGHLTNKGYGYSPDVGTVMMTSWRDMSQGTLTYGVIGSGKSYRVLRPVARRFRRTALALAAQELAKGRNVDSMGGALIADGKDGAIITDLEDLFDIVVKPGFRVAPYEGLEPDQIVKALRGANGATADERAKLWNDGGDAVLYHTAIIMKALVQHEQAYRAHTLAKLEGLERERLYLELDLAAAHKRNIETVGLESRLATLLEHMASLAMVVEADRTWFYTPFHHAKIIANVERTVPTGVGDTQRAGPKLLELVKYLGLEEPDLSVDDAGRERYAVYFAAYRDRQATDPESIHPDLSRPMSQLQASLEWALLEVPAMHKEQLQSFTLNSRGLIEKLLRGEKLRDQFDMPWHSIEKGELDVSQALYGKFVGLFIPPTQYGEAGELVMRLLKQRVMNGIKARGAYGEKWREMLPGQTEVMLMLDEAHLLLTPDDIDLFSISRSLGLMPFLATQGHESLINAFGSENAANLLANTMQSIIALKCSFITVEYLTKRFGQAMLTTFKQPTRGIDYDGGLEAFRHSVLNDRSHPYAAVYDQMRLQGAGRLTALRVDPVTNRTWRIGAENVLQHSELARDIDMPTGGKREVQPLFKPEEYPALLEPQGHAIVCLNRAGIKRIDLAVLDPALE